MICVLVEIPDGQCDLFAICQTLGILCHVAWPFVNISRVPFHATMASFWLQLQFRLHTCRLCKSHVHRKKEINKHYKLIFYMWKIPVIISTNKYNFTFTESKIMFMHYQFLCLKVSPCTIVLLFPKDQISCLKLALVL